MSTYRPSVRCRLLTDAGEIMANYFPLEHQLALGQFVAEVDPVLEAFCARSGYVRAVDYGAYPGRKVAKQTDVYRFIELYLAGKGPNEYFQEFFPQIPFYFSCGVQVNQGKMQFRIDGPFSQVKLPFVVLARHLEGLLDLTADALSLITREELIASGRSVDLSKPLTLNDLQA
jgi:hypothetical protein